MNEILNKTDTNSLLFAIETNLNDFYIRSSQHPNFDSNLKKTINWVKAKSADWPSCIFRANFGKQNIDSKIKKIISLIKKDKAPNGWTVGPLTKPKNLGQYLEKNGFSNVYHQSGMAVNLIKIKETPIIQNNLEICKVTNPDQLIKWSENVSKVFNIKIDIDLLEFLLETNNIQFYLGIFNNKVVSTLLLFLSAGVAGLHAVATLPDFRSKGFGYMMSRTALIDALNLGYKIGVLQASSLGEIIYRKLKFKKYCDINSYEIENGL